MSGNNIQPSPSQLNQYTIAFEGNSVACILTGVYLTLAATNLYLLRKKRYMALLSYTLVQLILTLVFLVMSLYNGPGQNLEMVGIVGPPLAATLEPWSPIVGDVAFVLNTWVSDAFLLYRCYVICVGNRYALVLPMLLYLATVGSSLAWLVVNSLPGQVYNSHTIQVAGLCYWTLSTTMNVCASSLICGRLWMHRRAVSKAVGRQQAAFYLGYIAMTLESALLYTVFAIIVLVVVALNSLLEFVFIPVLGAIQVIAPSLIVYLIARGISFETDEYGYGSTTAASIRFAPTANRAHTIAHLAQEDMSHGSDTLPAPSFSNTKIDQHGLNSFNYEVKREV